METKTSPRPRHLENRAKSFPTSLGSGGKSPEAAVRKARPRPKQHVSSAKYKYTRLSNQSKLALQRPILQIISNFQRTSAIRQAKAFVRWRSLCVDVHGLAPETMRPAPRSTIRVSAVEKFVVSQNVRRCLRGCFNAWVRSHFDRYKRQHSHMKSHVMQSGVLCVEKAVLRRAFMILKGHLELEVGIANEMREYLKSALNGADNDNDNGSSGDGGRG
eukprot:CAMPEP_0182470116 /NCGR_PEP_ID=MMETSP1319-20130603/18185_1 /TAXON_ID=172717 /ORGANISM="Bolidomonas pacifica, Strain RCC208" /LENGTH=216 /DNA_ID=CAMNT_0024670519 /DNA_START=46 /DNA_END=692 /DNA_ORIENTATION=+